MMKRWMLLLSLLVFLVSGINFAMAEDTPVLTMSLDKTTVAVDKGETITAKWSVSGGTGPYTVRIFWQVEGTIIQWKEQTYGDVSDTFQPTFGTKGKVSINGHDANGKHMNAESRDFAITGSPPEEALAVNFEMSNQAYDISKGELASAQVNVTGGRGPYRLHIEWIIKERLENNFLKDYTYYDPFITGFTGTKELSFKPLFGDEGTLRVAATDQAGRKAEKTVAFGLIGSPDAMGFVVNLRPQLPTPTYDVKVGETVSATWEAQGGVGPYKYSSVWEITDTANHWSDEINYVPYSSEHKSASYKPTFGDKGYFSVVAEDSLGRWRWASFEFNIVNASMPEPLKIKALLDRVNVFQGQSILGNWTVSGAVGECTYSYDWMISEREDQEKDIYQSAVDSKDTNNSFTPPKSGHGELMVTVKDGLNRTHFDRVFFRVELDAIPGDADGNGKLNLDDIVQVVEHIAFDKTLAYARYADSNRNRIVDEEDLADLIRRLVQD